MKIWEERLWRMLFALLAIATLFGINRIEGALRALMIQQTFEHSPERGK